MITVHIRRGDFGRMCKEGRKPPCHVPPVRYREAVERIQAKLRETRELEVSKVLVASGENPSSSVPLPPSSMA